MTEFEFVKKYFEEREGIQRCVDNGDFWCVDSGRYSVSWSMYNDGFTLMSTDRVAREVGQFESANQVFEKIRELESF